MQPLKLSRITGSLLSTFKLSYCQVQHSFVTVTCLLALTLSFQRTSAHKIHLSKQATSFAWTENAVSSASKSGKQADCISCFIKGTFLLSTVNLFIKLQGLENQPFLSHTTAAVGSPHSVASKGRSLMPKNKVKTPQRVSTLAPPVFPEPSLCCLGQRSS